MMYNINISWVSIFLLTGHRYSYDTPLTNEQVMSGGCFNYWYSTIDTLQEHIDELTDENDDLASDTLQNINNFKEILNTVQDLAKGAEYMGSGDTSELEFNVNFKKNIEKLKTSLESFKPL